MSSGRTNPSPAEAERIISENLPVLATETVRVSESLGRISSGPLVCDRDSPPFDRVMMDGYALRWKELRRMDGRLFRVMGQTFAGRERTRLSTTPFSCVEVATGAMLPEAADTVVPYEMTERLGDEVRLTEEGENLVRGHAVHARGSDALAGQEFLPSGSRMNAAEIAAALSFGHLDLVAAVRPRIVILSTGDELVAPGETPQPWQLRRSNDAAITAALDKAGFPGARCIMVKDTEAASVAALRRALKPGTWVITVGGVSKGSADHMPAAFKKTGIFVYFRGVLQRPGKPFGFGVAPAGNPVFALPGNPVSAFLCLHRYVIPALLKASGCMPGKARRMPLAEAVQARPGSALYVPVTLECPESGLVQLRPRRINNSGDFPSLIGTDGFVEIPPGGGHLPAGAPVPFIAW